MQVRRDKKGYDILEQQLKALGRKIGKVGWFPSAVYEDGTPVAAIAAQNEYGNPSKNIPARPFFRPTIAAKQGEWMRELEKGALAVLDGKTTAANVMQGVVQLAADQVAETITLIWTPALSPRTIAARLHRRGLKKVIGLIDKPLIDTKHMFGTLSGVVEDY